MGSLFKKNKPPSPPPPPPPAGYRDEIGGTEQVPVKNKDGTITYITRRLPLTEEQKKEQEAYDAIVKEALKEIEHLSSSSYTPDASTQKILDAWKQERSDYIDENFEKRSDVEEQNLARRGLSDSSAAEAIRRQRREDVRKSYLTLDNETEMMADDIRQNNLSYQQNLYNLASSRKNLDQAKLMQSAGNAMSQVNATNAFNRASIMDYYNRQNAAYQNQSSRFEHNFLQPLSTFSSSLSTLSNLKNTFNSIF